MMMRRIAECLALPTALRAVGVVAHAPTSAAKSPSGA